MMHQVSWLVGWFFISLIIAKILHPRHVEGEARKAKAANREPKPSSFGAIWFQVFIAPAVVILALVVIATVMSKS